VTDRPTTPTFTADTGTRGTSGPPELAEYAARLQTLTADIDELGSTELDAYFDAQLEICERLLGWIEADARADRSVDVDLQLSELSLLVENLEKNVELIETRRDWADDRSEKTVTVTAVEDEEAIQDAIEEAKTLGDGAVVSLPEDRYRTSGLVIEDAHDIDIVGEGETELLVTTKRSAFRIEGSSNVRIENISVDYETLPFTQGEIQSVDREAVAIEMTVEDGFPDPTLDYFMESNPPRGTLRSPSGAYKFDVDGGGPRLRGIERVEEGRFRVELWDNQARVRPGVVDGYEPGDYFAIHAQGPPGSEKSAYVDESEYITFKNVNIHASWANAFILTENTGLKFIDVSIVPKPGTDRMYATGADGFHTGNNRVGPYLENCETEHLGDDSIPVYTKAAVVASQERADTILLGKRYYDWAVGNFVQFVDGEAGDNLGVRTIERLDRDLEALVFTSGEWVAADVVREWLREGIDDAEATFEGAGATDTGDRTLEAIRSADRWSDLDKESLSAAVVEFARRLRLEALTTDADGGQDIEAIYESFGDTTEMVRHRATVTRLVLDEGVRGLATREALGKGKFGTEHDLGWDFMKVYPDGEEPPVEAIALPLSKQGTGAVIRNCDFGPHRANGIRLRSTNCLVERNRIHGIMSHAILANSGLNWLGGNIPRNDLIRHNTIEDVDTHGRGAIKVEHTLPFGRPGSADQLRRIYIRNNTLRNVEVPFDIQDEESVIRQNNTIE
jgi:hypothetical protein